MHRPDMAVIGLVVLSLWAPSGLALLEEGTSFEPSHEGAVFPVGWTEFNLGGAFSPEVRMVYPAMFAGEFHRLKTCVGNALRAEMCPCHEDSSG